MVDNAMIDSIKNKYLSNNKEDVLKHVEDVAEIAVRLAKAYNLDVEKTKLALSCPQPSFSLVSAMV